MTIKELIDYGNEQLDAFPEDTKHGEFVREVLDIIKAIDNTNECSASKCWETINILKGNNRQVF